jgi:hypothetical protein
MSIASGIDNTANAMTIQNIHHTTPVCRTCAAVQSNVLGIPICENAENSRGSQGVELVVESAS